ncbi:hypothetical protein C8R44DRAFT_741657 [Mycena epipterygia]|nr:hypothetical protein C8R44DRAFT_741657 [Mycena epipterygia]
MPSNSVKPTTNAGPGVHQRERYQMATAARPLGQRWYEYSYLFSTGTAYSTYLHWTRISMHLRQACAASNAGNPSIEQAELCRVYSGRQLSLLGYSTFPTSTKKGLTRAVYYGVKTGDVRDFPRPGRYFTFARGNNAG